MLLCNTNMSTRLLMLFALLTVAIQGCDSSASYDGNEECVDSCDVFGNGHRGSECSFDVECSADEGLSCRPATERYGRGTELIEDRQCLTVGLTGDYCDEDNDCMNGLGCRPIHAVEHSEYSSITGTSTNYWEYYGICEWPESVGGGCDSERDCTEDSVCESEWGTTYYNAELDDHFPGKCDVEHCTFDLSCGGDEVCRPDGSGEQSCLPLGERYEDCAEDDDCSDSLVCINVTDGVGSCDTP